MIWPISCGPYHKSESNKTTTLKIRLKRRIFSNNPKVWLKIRYRKIYFWVLIQYKDIKRFQYKDINCAFPHSIHMRFEPSRTEKYFPNFKSYFNIFKYFISLGLKSRTTSYSCSKDDDDYDEDFLLRTPLPWVVRVFLQYEDSIKGILCSGEASIYYKINVISKSYSLIRPEYLFKM